VLLRIAGSYDPAAGNRLRVTLPLSAHDAYLLAHDTLTRVYTYTTPSGVGLEFPLDENLTPV